MTGCEWVIEAHGCNPAGLAHPETLNRLFTALVDGMDLHPVQPALWHQFPGSPAGGGGVTGLLLLSESHLACHTFPEFSSLCLNVFCCKPRAEYDFKAALHSILGATRISVRKLERPYSE
ncbi:S-adenosylmethionine decarboxylase [Bryobacter aggregatus]|uniref:S-adenosylmethionine decarboxylase n=1 Tax=Bryobacter aggregatus TaxID=360054 RepID=UPI0004E1ED64|nr:S-adenosylmethionine decarboxylase [Bryobacter aggregatus]